MSDLAAWLSEQLDDTEFQEPNPVEVMADVKAKRALIELFLSAHADNEAETDTEGAWVTTARVVALWEAVSVIASAYSTRPGYDAASKAKPPSELWPRYQW